MKFTKSQILLALFILVIVLPCIVMWFELRDKKPVIEDHPQMIVSSNFPNMKVYRHKSTDTFPELYIVIDKNAYPHLVLVGSFNDLISVANLAAQSTKQEFDDLHIDIKMGGR